MPLSFDKRKKLRGQHFISSFGGGRSSPSSSPSSPSSPLPLPPKKNGVEDVPCKVLPTRPSWCVYIRFPKKRKLKDFPVFVSTSTFSAVKDWLQKKSIQFFHKLLIIKYTSNMQYVVSCLWFLFINAKIYSAWIHSESWNFYSRVNGDQSSKSYNTSPPLDCSLWPWTTIYLTTSWKIF